MIIGLALAIVLGVLAYILFVRPSDIPEPEPPSPFAHLEDRKAAIYEGLRDLQFEYRLGKLSDADYQRSKSLLQAELAQVLAGIDEIAKRLGIATKRVPAAAKNAPPRKAPVQCPSCGAQFQKAMKFCGECGKEMN